MNSGQLTKIGVPMDCMGAAIQTIQAVAKHNRSVPKDARIDIKKTVALCVEAPDTMLEDELFGPLAAAIVEDREFVPSEPCDFKVWGLDQIDPNAVQQLQDACSIPSAQKAALMPDAHYGYGLPIGGVIALENAISPAAVGVDIACRMRLSIWDIRPELLDKRKEFFCSALEDNTVFGTGQEQDKNPDHPVLDMDWDITKITSHVKDRATKQLGTSGSGNHFVEWGVFEIQDSDNPLNINPGHYVALLSHSGSRGAGAAVCDFYNSIARSRLPSKYQHLNYLAWLDMDTAEGQEYWAAMNLMGEYAAANHEVIHRYIGRAINEKPIAVVENHHNFAWLENHFGKDVYVHRKGATPAAKGQLGVIPGSMGDPAFVVMGRGNADSLNSASHGAGRRMSRKKAKDTYRFNAVRGDLAKKGITVLSAGADEVPGVYKNIHEVMVAQQDLVDIIARFDPKIVKMSGD